VRAWAGSRQGIVEVSIVDLSTGTVIDVTPFQQPMRSGSIVKVAIAVAAIRTRRAHGSALSGGEERLLTNMIRTSDNKAASALWSLSGSQRGLEQTIGDAGMASSRPDRGGAWASP
jgi:hypothetical protein